MIVDVNKIKDTVKEYLNIDALKVETIQMFNDWLQKTQYGYRQNSQDIINNIAYIDALSSGYSEWVDLPILDTISLDGIEIIIDYIKETAEYAKEQGDYTKEQGDYAKEQGDYAKESGDTALEAAEIANNTKGWTTVHLFIKVSEKIIVKRLTDYIGGTGTKPTDNIDQYVSENGYTSDIDEALNFKGDKGDSAYQVWLEEGNIGTEEDYFAYLQKPATDAIGSIQAVEQTVSENESLRIISETSRKDAEDLRLSAEDIRIENETERGSKESVRIENETERVSSENTRKDNEAERVSSENTREDNEITRVENEALRQSAETLRLDAELLRKSGETGRVQAEGERGLRETARVQSESERLSAEIIRRSNEGDRIENEDIRVQNEAERISKEGIRQSNEADRVENESERVQAESERLQAESERQATIQEAVTATNLANDKITKIDEVVIPNAELATQNAIDVKTDYETVVKPDMIAKANYAEAQANYAKEQGEAVDGRISEVEGKIGYSLGWYGIEFDETIANSACTRIGEMDLHRRLPIQNQMRRCLLLDNGKVNYYLHKDDSTKKADGTDAVLDGTDGQVMVEIPAHWRRFEKDGTVHRVKISDFKLEGFHFVPKAYRSAYEATVERSTNKLSSIVNMDADYRGGNNNSANDGASNTLLGRPATAISGTNFALYAKNRGDRWCMDVYHVKKAMDWLYYIEFANFNSQLPFNPVLTAEGFKQGGLGAGVTDLNSGKWSAFNGYYPFVSMGYTNSLGNKTGVKPFNMPVEYDENIFTTNVPSYRGVENPFGHIWKWADGLKINIQADDAGGESQMFVCEDPLLFQHSNYDGYEKRGLLPRAGGYISKMIIGEFGELIPKEAVGGSTTYFADYFYTTLPASGESQRGVLFGGYAHDGATAGLACSYSNYAFSDTYAYFGSRLCFLP